jgi:dynein regulatory complex protein 1
MDRHGDDIQPTMQQRINERRAVLEAKMRAMRTAGNADTNKADAADAAGMCGKGEEQIRATRRELTALKATASDAVTRYRVSTDAFEGERRVREEILAATRTEKIQDDTESSFKAHGCIQMSFDNLFDRNPEVPQELMRDLVLQKEACKKVIDVKDTLIAELRQQMRDKEEEYVRSLKQQADNIDRLIDTMHSQTDTTVSAYNTGLTAVEEAYVQERRELLDANDKEIEALVLQRSNREKEHVKRRDHRVWEDQKALDDKYEENAEKFNKSKMDNLHDIHGLAQELESLRARFLLNAEKLNYNLQVLRERVNENKKASDLHRKKISRLTDVCSTLIARYGESNKKFQQTNRELTESYRRVTEQYKDLQIKFQHFEQADADKYQQVWDMNERDCMALVHRCMQSDRVVFEEMLGVAWQAPSLDFWLEAVAADTGAARDEEAKADDGPEEQIELGEMGDGMLQIIYSQVPFLVEEKARRVIDDLEGQDSHTLKVESVLAALDIKQTSDVQQMLDFFVVPTEDGESAMINPQEVVRALQRFLQDRKAKKEASALKLDLAHVETQQQQERESKKEAETVRRSHERAFWKRMSDVVPDSHLRLWTGVERAMGKYLRQLQKRQKLIDETDGIRKQNDELRTLLNQYLGSRLNEELFSPPQLQVAQAAQPGQ